MRGVDMVNDDRTILTRYSILYSTVQGAGLHDRSGHGQWWQDHPHQVNCTVQYSPRSWPSWEEWTWSMMTGPSSPGKLYSTVQVAGFHERSGPWHHFTRYTVLYLHKTSLSRKVTNFHPHQVYLLHTLKISSKLLESELSTLSFHFHFHIFARSKLSSDCW